MARWTDIATWRGNGENQGPGGMVEHRGLVLHIAVGWYEGTISWQRNPASNVSSHFVVGKERGELAQMVDTATRAWTQGDGNGRWLSSENEGFLASDRRNPGGWEKLSPWQIEANAQILAKAHLVYGVPLKVADHPGEKGLGHHSMDREWLDEQWGHDECPGAAIVAQKPLIVARAKEIVGGDDMDLSDKVNLWDEKGNKPWRAGKTLGVTKADPDVTVGQLLMWGGEVGHLTHNRVLPALAEIKATLKVIAGHNPAAAVREEISALTDTLVAAVREAVPAANQDTVEAALRAVLGSVDEAPNPS